MGTDVAAQLANQGRHSHVVSADGRFDVAVVLRIGVGKRSRIVLSCVTGRLLQPRLGVRLFGKHGPLTGGSAGAVSAVAIERQRRSCHRVPIIHEPAEVACDCCVSARPSGH
jgi:hypothetical protein